MVFAAIASLLAQVSPFEVTLKDGRQVRLIRVQRVEGRRIARAWMPNGQAAPLIEIPPGGDYPVQRIPITQLVLALKDTGSDFRDVEWLSSSGRKIYSDSHWANPSTTVGTVYHTGFFEFASGTPVVAAQVRIPLGKWQIFPHPERLKPQVSVSPNRLSVVLARPSKLEGQNWRIRAWDTGGKELSEVLKEETGQPARLSSRFYLPRGQRLARFELDHRPVQVVDFQKIALVYGKPLLQHPRGGGGPPFRPTRGKG